MKQLLGIVAIVLIVWTYGCKSKNNKVNAPVSDLGHIDLVLDSLEFNSILNDSFLINEFASVFRDTVLYENVPSYDMYLVGQENFIHISLAKAFWEGKAGSGAIVFQTRKPEMKDSLFLAWKSNYNDSLSSHVYKGEEMELGEVMTNNSNLGFSKDEPIFFPNLSSYSKETYKNWGFGDTSITMRQFTYDWDPATSNKLFKKITRLNIQITETEFKDVESALITMGYKRQDSTFTHTENPTLVLNIVNENRVPKYQQIEIELSQPTSDRKFTIGNSYDVTISGTKMILSAKQT